MNLITPGECKMGGIGGPAANTRQAYASGPVGIMSRSGGMTTEIASTLTAAGLGQSTAVSIGGDAIIGTTYAELMPFFEADPETKAIAIYSEPGGRMEAELAEWVVEHKSRLPIVAFMAGRFMDEMQGMRFGHAGTIVEGKEDTTAAKIERMEKAGISVAERDRGDPEADPGAAVAEVVGARKTARRAAVESVSPFCGRGLGAPTVAAGRARPRSWNRSRSWRSARRSARSCVGLVTRAIPSTRCSPLTPRTAPRSAPDFSSRSS